MPLNKLTDWIDVPEAEASILVPETPVTPGTITSEEISNSKGAFGGIAPEDAAKVLDISSKKAVPFESVVENKDSWVDVADSEQTAEHLKSYPKTSAFLKDPVNMALVKDHIHDITKIEDIVNFAEEHRKYETVGREVMDSLTNAAATIDAAVARFPATLYDFAALPQNLFFKAVGKPELQVRSPKWLRDNPIATYYDKQAEAYQLPELSQNLFEQIKKGDFKGAGRNIVLQTVSQGPQHVFTLGSAWAKAPQAGLALMGMVAAAQKQKQNADRNIDPATSAINSIVTGGWEAGTEYLDTVLPFNHWAAAIEKSFGKVAAREVIKEVGKTLAASFGAEFTGEGVNSIAQDFTDYAMGVNPDALKGTVSRGMNAALIGGFTGVSMAGPTSIAAGISSSRVKAGVNKRVEFYKALGDQVVASKLAARSKGKTQEFLENVVKNGPMENIYVDTEKATFTLEQSGINPEEFFADLGVSALYHEALVTGDDVKIPMSVWAEKVAGTEHYNKFADDIKFSPDDFTARQVKDKEAEYAKLTEDYFAGEEAKIATTDEIKTQIADETEKAYKYIKDVAWQAEKPEGMTDAAWAKQEKAIETQLRIAARRHAVEGYKRGISAVEHFQQNPYIFQGEGQKGVEPVIKKKSVVQIKDDKDLARMVRSRVDYGEAGKRMATPEGNNVSWGSTFPDYFKNKGYGKADTLNILDKFLNDEPLTDSQRHIVNDLIGGEKQELIARGEYYDPAEVQAASSENPQEMFQLSPAATAPVSSDPFYSKVAKIIEANPQGKWSKEQLKGFLKGKVSTAEMEALNIEGLPDKASKQEILDHIQANFPQVEEVVKGGGHPIPMPQYLETKNQEGLSEYTTNIGRNSVLITETPQHQFLAFPDDGAIQDNDGKLFNTLNDAKQWLQELNQPKLSVRETKYSQYQLPGGENYREVLIKVPTEQGLSEEVISDLMKEYKLSRKQVIDDIKSGNLQLSSKDTKAMQKQSSFTSSHWDEPNVLAHMRMNDRTTPDGKKVLFIEEIQSDWAREGRATGFIDYNKELPEGTYVVNENKDNSGNWYIANGESVQISSRRYRSREEAISKWNESHEKGVPPHPLLKNWQELAIKRILKEAAEGGYDAISWTTGEQQAERYDLSEQVDKIEWIPADKMLRVYKDGKPVISQTLKSEKDIENYVGKEPAKRLLESGIKESSTRPPLQEIEGKDLKIGGEWAANLYDKQIPNILKDLTKEKAGNIDLLPGAEKLDFKVKYDEAEGKWVAESKDVGRQLFDTKEEADSYAKEMSSERMSQPAINITPEIRDKVLGEGQPLFQAPMNKDVDPNRRVNVVNLSDAKKANTAKVKATLKKLVGQKLETATKDWVLSVVPKNIGHLVYSSLKGQHPGIFAQRGIALSHIDTVLHSAVLIESGPAKVEKQGTLYHRFYVPVKFKDGVKTIRIVALQDGENISINEANLYDVFVEKKKAAEGDSNLTSATRDAASTANISISDMLSGVKDDNGKPYFQGETGPAPRGKVNFTPDAAIITIMKGADASTVLHELSHVWLKDIHEYVMSGAADESYMKDWKVLSDWLGVKEGQTELTKDQQEQFARAQELYLRKGEAPSKDLRYIFRKVGKWLTRVYKNAKELNVTLTPEVEEVFSRMYATEEEVKAAQLRNGMTDWKKELSLDKGETLPGDVGRLLNKIDELRGKAENEAYDTLLNKLMGEITTDTKAAAERKRAELTKSAGATLQSDPDVNLHEFISLKFKNANARDIASRYLEVVNGTKVDALNGREKVQFELIAEMRGYSTAEVMANEILKSKTREDKVRDFVDAGMVEYNGLMNSDAIKVEAEKAIRNDFQTEAEALEIELLSSYLKTGKVPEIVKEKRRMDARLSARIARATAEKMLSQRKVTEATDYVKYFSAEKKLAIKFTKAMKDKDFKKALEYKKQMLLNRELAREAMRNDDRYNSMLKAVDKVYKRGMELFNDQESFAQAAALLERFGFGTRSDYDPTMKELSLSSWADKMDAAYAGEADSSPVSIADWITDETVNRSYKELSFTEMADVVNAIKNVVTVSNKIDKLYALDATRTVEETARNLSVELQSNVKSNYAPGVEPKAIKVRFGDKVIRVMGIEGLLKWMREYSYSIKTLDTICFTADGNKDFGTWFKTLLQPVRDASNKESGMFMDSVEKYKAIWNQSYTKAEKKDIYSREVYIPEFGAAMTKERLLAMALNMGTESNSDRLFESAPVGFQTSFQWDKYIRDEQGKRVEHADYNRALVENMVKSTLSKYLTAKDWQFVQGVWNLLGEYWTETVQLHKDMTGFEPLALTPMPFTMLTADGKAVELRGGYYPLKQDLRADEKAAVREISTDALYVDNTPAYKAVTSTGRTKARVKADYSVSLDLSLINRHLNDTIHDLSFRKVVYDINRLLANKTFMTSVKNTLSEEGYRSLQLWANALATGGQSEKLATDAISKAARMMNNKVVPAIILGRVSVIVQNFANFLLAGNRVEGFGHMDAVTAFIRTGLFNYMPKAMFNWKAANEMKSFVFERSQFMLEKHFNPEYTLKTFKGVNTLNDGVKEFLTGLLSGSDEMTNIPMWIEAHAKEMDRTGDETQARIYADKLVERITGSPHKYDQAKILRGSDMEKLFTKLYSFFSAEYQNWLKETGMIKQAPLKNSGRFVGFVASRVLFVALSAALVGQLPGADDDDEEKVKKWFRLFLGYGTSFFPFFREVAMLATDKFIGTQNFGYRPSPFVTAVEGVGKAADALGDTLFRDGDPQDALEAGMKLFSYSTGSPDQLNSMFWNLYDYWQNGMQPEFGDIYRRRPKSKR